MSWSFQLKMFIGKPQSKDVWGIGPWIICQFKFVSFRDNKTVFLEGIMKVTNLISWLNWTQTVAVSSFVLTQHVNNMPRAMRMWWRTSIRIVDTTVLTIYWFMVYKVIFVGITGVCQQRFIVVRITICHRHQSLICSFFKDFSLKWIREKSI